MDLPTQAQAAVLLASKTLQVPVMIDRTVGQSCARKTKTLTNTGEGFNFWWRFREPPKDPLKRLTNQPLRPYLPSPMGWWWMAHRVYQHQGPKLVCYQITRRAQDLSVP